VLPTTGLVALGNNNTLRTINKVALHRAELVFGQVTACGQVKHFGM